MTKEEFKELEKENAYISNLLKVATEANVEKLNEFFFSLIDDLKAYDFMVCAHFHYNPIRIDVFDGTDEGSQSLTIANFEVIKKTDNFDPLVLDLIEIWLRDLK